MERIHVEPVLVKTSHFTERLEEKKRVGQERMVIFVPCDWENITVPLEKSVTIKKERDEKKPMRMGAASRSTGGRGKNKTAPFGQKKNKINGFRN